MSIWNQNFIDTAHVIDTFYAEFVAIVDSHWKLRFTVKKQDDIAEFSPFFLQTQQL